MGVSRVSGPFLETAKLDVSQVWERGADNLLSSLYYRLQVFPVYHVATGVPDYTAVHQDALYCGLENVYQQFLAEPIIPQGPQKKEVLWAFLSSCEVFRLHVRSSDLWTTRNLNPATHSTSFCWCTVK